MSAVKTLVKMFCQCANCQSTIKITTRKVSERELDSLFLKFSYVTEDENGVVLEDRNFKDCRSCEPALHH